VPVLSLAPARVVLGVALLASASVDAFLVEDLLRERAESGRLYHEFIRTHDLSVGLYVLPAGGEDPQGPHTEDEVYHVISGRAHIRVGDEDQAVQAGSVIFVGADVEHRFNDIEEELVALVMFGPAEYTHRVDHQSGRQHGAAPA
jgi:mannose-6-phosphate isomerase-like protein (cupin superfamily)